MKEYRNKMEEEYQLDADTNAERKTLFKKVVMRAAEEIFGATKGGNTWRGRPGVGMKGCRRA